MATTAPGAHRSPHRPGIPSRNAPKRKAFLRTKADKEDGVREHAYCKYKARLLSRPKLPR